MTGNWKEKWHGEEREVRACAMRRCFVFIASGNQSLNLNKNTGKKKRSYAFDRRGENGDDLNTTNNQTQNKKKTSRTVSTEREKRGGEKKTV